MPLELNWVFELFILSAAKPGCATVFMLATVLKVMFSCFPPTRMYISQGPELKIV